jgi:NDP-sugar pyrophosphorylase family protein
MVKETAAICLWGGIGDRQRMIARKMGDPNLRNLNAAPKPLFPIATVPMCRITVERLKEAGIHEVYATTHYLHDVIQSYFFNGAGKTLGVRELWKEQVRMGTAPGLVMNLLIRGDLRDKTIVVPSGDIVSNMDIAAAVRQHKETGNLCTIALNPVPEWEVHRFGTARVENGLIKEFREKRPPHEALRSKFNGRDVFLNNSSFYLFEPAVFLREIAFYDQSGLKVGDGSIVEKMFPDIDREFLAQLRAGAVNARSPQEAADLITRFGKLGKHFRDFGHDLFPSLAKNGLMQGYVFDEYWNDVGDNETYWMANWHALTGRLGMKIPFPETERGVWMAKSAEVNSDAIIPPVILGNNVKIEKGVKVGPFAVVDDNWLLEEGVDFEYSITWPSFTDRSEYQPEPARIQVIRRGTVIGKSIIGGIMPISDHMYKNTVGDSPSKDHTLIVRSFLGLNIPTGSTIAVAKQTKRVLIIDDSKEFIDPLVETLQRQGWERLEVVTSYEVARQKLASERFDVIMLDAVLDQDAAAQNDQSDGVRLLKEEKLPEAAKNHQTPVIFWSGFSSLASYKGLTAKETSKMAETGLKIMDKEEERAKVTNVGTELLKLMKLIEDK